MEKYNKFREEYKEFCFESFEKKEIDGALVVTYNFEIKGLSTFSPTWTFPNFKENQISSELLDNMIFNLGLVELVSYWKITCSPSVIIKCGSLTEKQASWWKKLYFNGLGEFFYLNNIIADKDNFMNIISSGTNYKIGDGNIQNKNVLVPVGGGKDSSVSIELLKKYDGDLTAYVINSRGATESSIASADIPAYRVKRTLDKNMLDLNSKGFLNGHTPFSALVSFSSLISASFCGAGFVPLSNESSANESTVSGSDVNHQYSKSFEFEIDFTEYEKEFINSGVKYFSFLRPLSEYQIAMLFSKFTQYHEVFRSCNAGSKSDIWCCRCPKCLFVFLIMLPHIEHSRLVELFGVDLINDENMLEDFKKLIGLVSEKPFECVGSRDEVNFSIIKGMEKLEDEKYCLIEFYKTTELYAEYKSKSNPYYDMYNNEHIIPESFETILKDALLEAKNDR